MIKTNSTRLQAEAAAAPTQETATLAARGLADIAYRANNARELTMMLMDVAVDFVGTDKSDTDFGHKVEAVLETLIHSLKVMSEEAMKLEDLISAAEKRMPS